MLAAGERLAGHYRIVSELGKGGMGHVYLAHHEDLDAKVALKELTLPFDADPVHIERFRFEGRILHKLRHPRLPLVYDFFKEGDQYYIAMEFVEGRSLSQVVRDDGAVPAGTLLNWIDQLCEVLDYLHTHDPPIIFRDLKPPNIMITQGGDLKLIDFGIAKLFDIDANDGQTSTVIRGAGTPGFAPPEQYGAGTDERSDIYSLGATLWSVCMSRIPPPSVNLAAGAAALPSLEQGRPDLPPLIVNAINRMMALKREERPQTIKEVKALMRGVQVPPGAGLTTELPSHLMEEPPSDRTTVPAKSARPQRAGVPVWVPVGAAGIAIAAFIGWKVLSTPAPQPTAAPAATQTVVVTATPSATPTKVAAVTHTPAPRHVRKIAKHHAPVTPPHSPVVPQATQTVVVMQPVAPNPAPVAPPPPAPAPVSPPPQAALPQPPVDTYGPIAVNVLTEMRGALAMVPPDGKGPGYDKFHGAVSEISARLQGLSGTHASLTAMNDALVQMQSIDRTWGEQAQRAQALCMTPPQPGGGPPGPPPGGGPPGGGGPPPQDEQMDQMAQTMQTARNAAVSDLDQAEKNLLRHD
ncbi:MAG TPA: serine/threonine-protein kinase [Candidatus Xenobia bacterium]|jgi:serine/threonine protein kinase